MRTFTKVSSCLLTLNTRLKNNSKQTQVVPYKLYQTVFDQNRKSKKKQRKTPQANIRIAVGDIYNICPNLYYSDIITIYALDSIVKRRCLSG